MIGRGSAALALSEVVVVMALLPNPFGMNPAG
jgi:hypothetical protein